MCKRGGRQLTGEKVDFVNKVTRPNKSKQTFCFCAVKVRFLSLKIRVKSDFPSVMKVA